MYAGTYDAAPLLPLPDGLGGGGLSSEIEVEGDFLGVGRVFAVVVVHVGFAHGSHVFGFLRLGADGRDAVHEREVAAGEGRGRVVGLGGEAGREEAQVHVFLVADDGEGLAGGLEREPVEVGVVALELGVLGALGAVGLAGAGVVVGLGPDA